MVIALPLGLLLLFGLMDAEPLMRLCMVLADIALLTLFFLSFKEKTRKTLLIEVFVYFLLLSPLIFLLTSFQLHWFNYYLFIIPISCFVVFYPISVFLSYKEYKRALKLTGG